MAKLTSKQANELAGYFLGMAQAIGDFRYENWSLLSADDNQKLGNLQWSILNYGEDILAFSTILVMEDVKNSIEKIKGITSRIKENMHTVKVIQKGIDVAAAIVTLGAAIISKNARSITDSVDGLVKVWES
jgi:UDP-N-acetylmuramyl pentapeptide phosphotransferase/UDP-N-acetylglucosamine-1-phosphate transferase